MSHARSEYSDFRRWRPMPTTPCWRSARSPPRPASTSSCSNWSSCAPRRSTAAPSACSITSCGREPRHSRRQAQSGRGLARGAAIFVARARRAGVDGGADTCSPTASATRSMRRQRRILREGTGLSDVGDRLDQCLEPVRRCLSLDPAGAQEGRCGAARRP